jgi:hypothetical protein
MKIQILKRGIVMSVLFTLVMLGASCKQEVAAPEDTPITPDTANASATQAATSRVAKIVFVGQKQACPCTRKRIDETWKTLQGVLAKGPKIAVERIHLDVDEERYDELDELKSMIVPPGIYFFDKDSKLIELLQGGAVEAKIADIIKQ